MLSTRVQFSCQHQLHTAKMQDDTLAEISGALLEGGHAVTVLYRDDHFIAVNKPSGMIVHRGWGHDEVTVHDIVRDDVIGAPIFGLHRLDRGTSGVLLFALDSETASHFQRQIDAGSVWKRYLTLVRGPMLEPVVVDHAISTRGGSRRVPAVTEFSPIAHFERWSLVEAIPRTGRLHQIRKHLRHLSHPVVGDVLYGKGEVNRFFREQYGLCRLALHAAELRFTSMQSESIAICADMPPDLATPLELLQVWPILTSFF
jgi:tRNA pseudouridine65 synthase